MAEHAMGRFQGNQSEPPQTVVTQLESASSSRSWESPQRRFGWRSPVSPSRPFSALPPVLFLKQSLSCYTPSPNPAELVIWPVTHGSCSGTPAFTSAPCLFTLQCACHTPATQASACSPNISSGLFVFRCFLPGHPLGKFNFLSCLLATCYSSSKTQDWKLR